MAEYRPLRRTATNVSQTAPRFRSPLAHQPQPPALQPQNPPKPATPQTRATNLVSSSRANEGKINGTSYEYQCWGYDGFGNRLYELENQTTNCPSPALTSTQVSSYSPPSGSLYNWSSLSTSNKVTFSTVNSASSGFTPDLAGNVTYDGVNAYVYDMEGRICAVKNTNTGSMTQYVYDAEGQRVAKGTITSWPASGATCAAPTTANGFTLTNVYLRGLHGDQDTELNGQGALIHTNVYVEGDVTATWWNSSAGWEWSYTFSDWLGTKRIQVNPNSQAENVWQSDPYGDYMTPIVAGTDATEHHFTGKERDAETATGPLNTGNDYFGARYYASSMGRFTSPDWSAIPWPVPYSDLANPQSLNLYVYGANNPLRFKDLDGHWHQQCGTTTYTTNARGDTVVNGNCSDVPDFWDGQWWANHASQAWYNTKQAWNNTVKFAHSPRGKLLGKSIKHLTIGGLKVGAAVAGVAAAPETGGASLALTAYGAVGATGDLTGGTTELIGSILGSDEDIEKVSDAGDVVTAITTVSGATTLVVTGGNVEAASHAASIEDLVVTGGTSAVTGEALTLGDKLGVMDDGSDLW